MEYNSEQIGKLIRGQRKRLGLTQDKLGKMLGVTGKQISNYEKGKLRPPQDTLLKMAQLFNCEYGYLLGEECYKDGSKLNTAICESLGMTSKAVESLRIATHKGLTQELAERQNAISRFFESPYVGSFIDCLVDAINISDQLSSLSDSAQQDLINRYGKEIADKAMIYSSFSDSISDSETSQPELQEAVKNFESFVDRSRNMEYNLKVARYELREAFELLVRNIS